MKKVKILSVVCVMILAAVIFAGCAPEDVGVIGGADGPTSIVVEEEKKTDEVIGGADGRTDVAAEEGETGETISLEGTTWALTMIIEADGKEITEELPEYIYEFKADGKVSRTAGEGSAEGTYEAEGNGVIMNFNEGETQLGIVENGQLQVFEGKGAYIFEQK